MQVTEPGAIRNTINRNKSIGISWLYYIKGNNFENNQRSVRKEDNNNYFRFTRQFQTNHRVKVQ
jgi:hypothetical protein